MQEAVLDIRLECESFDASRELAEFSARHRNAGAIVSFLGQVRAKGSDEGGLAVEALELRHYAPLTLPGMQKLGRTILSRWPLEGLLILHRVGVLYEGEPIVLVAAAARHRRAAFCGADFAMDHLKSQSWFWKREKTGGKWQWIEPRPADLHDLARWQKD